MHQIKVLSLKYDVTVVANTAEVDFFLKRGVRANLIQVPIPRKISIVADVIALFKLAYLFHKEHFVLVHSVTPKAGFIGMIAGRVGGVSVRIHTFTGQVWATKKGVYRLVLKSVDRITAAFATVVLSDSHTQRDFMIKEKIVAVDNCRVLAGGSISGVNSVRFCPNVNYRNTIRAQYSLPGDSVVFVYMARLTRDKGAILMAQGFAEYAARNSSVFLMIIGPDEEGLRPFIKQVCANCFNRVRLVDYVTNPEQYLAAGDVFCLPSFREGFGSVMICASSVGLPVIASRIYGTEDAVQDGLTGLLFEKGNIDEFVSCMEKLVCDDKLRKKLGSIGRDRVIKDFSEVAVTKALVDLYASVVYSLRGTVHG